MRQIGGLPTSSSPLKTEPMEIRDYWKSRQRSIDKALKASLPSQSAKPATIHRAMHYSLFAGGKRLRPVLCLAGAEAIRAQWKQALPLACAVECIHTYSLIHDDLPCMDDDDLRRGKPTSHKVFGEAIAVLAGDALLTHAFDLAGSVPGWSRYRQGDIVRELAHAGGSRALIAGQVADIENEGHEITLPQLRYIHQNKTAALIASSIRLGAMSANATPRQLAALTEFGQSLGLAFQVMDDILDITQTSEQLGKSAGKDVKALKATYPALMGIKKAKSEAARLTARADKALDGLGPRAIRLREIAGIMLDRQH
jgi:geranylgeranyl diphosphate synthase type II